MKLSFKLLLGVFFMSLSLLCFAQGGGLTQDEPAAQTSAPAEDETPFTQDPQEDPLAIEGAYAQPEPEPAAKEPELKAIGKINAKKIQLGRKFLLEVELPVPAELDREASSSSDFAIIEETAGSTILTKTLAVLPLNLGEIDLGKITFIDENGKSFNLDSIKLDVAKTKTKIAKTGLADIRSPYRPFNRWIILWVALVIAAGFAAYKVFMALKNAPKAKESASPYQEDNRPYHIIALEQIENLLKEGLWERELYKSFYIKLVDIFRGYLTARFAIDAHQYTSRDLLKKLKTLNNFKADMEEVRRFQKSADLVKFAKVIPSESERDRDIHYLKDIILDTRQKDYELTPAQRNAASAAPLAVAPHTAEEEKKKQNPSYIKVDKNSGAKDGADSSLPSSVIAENVREDLKKESGEDGSKDNSLQENKKEEDKQEEQGASLP